jgi:molecular chaperone DnaJ
VQTRQNTPFGTFTNVRTCDVCRGEGKIVLNPCPDCSGKGKVRRNAKLKVKIPNGIDDSQTISVRGEGDAGIKGGPSGDLYITVGVKPHPLFRRNATDVLCEIPIPIVPAALGGELEIPTLDGMVKYDVPEGTQNGSAFKIKGKGIPYLRGSGRGDHYFQVVVEVPKKLHEKQKALLRQFAEEVGEKGYEQRADFFRKMKNLFDNK